MRRARQPRTTRSGRFLRGHRPDRNPLRRGVHRVESAILAALIAGFCVGAPLLAYAAVTVTHSSALSEMREQQATYHQVQATLLDAAVWISGYPAISGPEANASWIAPDGRRVTGVVSTTTDAPAGGTLLIWTDSSGNQVTPLQASMIGPRESIAATGAVTGLAGLLIVAGLLARWVLGRRAMTAWDADWLVTEPRWTSRR
jgi:hypothetical protein